MVIAGEDKPKKEEGGGGGGCRGDKCFETIKPREDIKYEWRWAMFVKLSGRRLWLAWEFEL